MHESVALTQMPQADATQAPCPKCHSTMIHVTNIRHPFAPNMMKSTFVCRPCNRTRTYILPVTGLEVAVIEPQAA
jgi:C4-type Zn-finger protein